MKLSPHFSASEFACRCGCGLSDVSPVLISTLELIRDKLGGKRITVLSGRRCAAHNRNVGGAKNSQHLLGTAADIQVQGMTPQQIYDAIEAIDDKKLAHIGGLGLYPTFVHIDIRIGKARWLQS